MWDLNTVTEKDRSRFVWWIYVLTLGGTFLFILYSFIGVFVLGIFGYYATRPLYDRINCQIDSNELVAGATVLFVILPVFLLLTYTGFSLINRSYALVGGGVIDQGLLKQAFGIGPLPAQGWQAISAMFQHPTEAVQNYRRTIRSLLTVGIRLLTIFGNILLTLVLALALSFYLLRDDDRIASWFRNSIADEDTATYAYLMAVDGDLETLYYGNLLFVILMSAIAAGIYLGANMIAPEGLRIPIPLILAVLTGISALIPLIVTKVVYVPLVGYLALMAMSVSGGQMWFPIALLGISVVVLDLAPQMLIQPYITGGNEIHMGLMMFAYILGPILFGWYGFLYLPLLLVLAIEVIRIVFTQLIHNEPLTPTVEGATSLSTGLSEHSDHKGSADDSGNNEIPKD